MTGALGLAVLLLLVIVCVAMVVTMQRRDNRLDSLRRVIQEGQISFETPVRAKVRVGRGLGFKPVRARTDLVVRPGFVQIRPDAMRRNRLLGVEVILGTDGALMSVRSDGAIVIDGQQVGEPVSVAVSCPEAQQLWDALVEAGVEPQV